MNNRKTPIDDVKESSTSHSADSPIIQESEHLGDYLNFFSQFAFGSGGLSRYFDLQNFEDLEEELEHFHEVFDEKHSVIGLLPKSQCSEVEKMKLLTDLETEMKSYEEKLTTYLKDFHSFYDASNIEEANVQQDDETKRKELQDRYRKFAKVQSRRILLPELYDVKRIVSSLISRHELTSVTNDEMNDLIRTELGDNSPSIPAIKFVVDRFVWGVNEKKRHDGDNPGEKRWKFFFEKLKKSEDLIDWKESKDPSALFGPFNKGTEIDLNERLDDFKNLITKIQKFYEDTRSFELDLPSLTRHYRSLIGITDASRQVNRVGE